MWVKETYESPHNYDDSTVIRLLIVNCSRRRGCKKAWCYTQHGISWKTETTEGMMIIVRGGFNILKDAVIKTVIPACTFFLRRIFIYQVDALVSSSNGWICLMLVIFVWNIFKILKADNWLWWKRELKQKHIVYKYWH